MVYQRYYSSSVVYGRIAFMFSPEQFSESVILDCVSKLNKVYPRLSGHVPDGSIVKIISEDKEIIRVHLAIKNFQSFEFKGNRKGESPLPVLEKMTKFIINNFSVHHNHYPCILQKDDMNFDTITKGFERQMVAGRVEIGFSPFAYKNSKPFAEGIDYLKENLEFQIEKNPSIRNRIHLNLSIVIFDRADKDDPFRFLIKWCYSPKGILYPIMESGNRIDFGTCRKICEYIKYYFPEIISGTAFFELDFQARILTVACWHNIEIKYDASAFKKDEIEEAIQHLKQKYPDLDKKLPKDCLIILRKDLAKRVLIGLPSIDHILCTSESDLYYSGERAFFQPVKAKDLLEKIMDYLNDNIEWMK